MDAPEVVTSRSGPPSRGARRPGAGLTFIPGLAMLLSVALGPSLIRLPNLFQRAGWVLPMAAIVAGVLLSALAGLHVIRILNRVRLGGPNAPPADFSALLIWLFGPAYGACAAAAVSISFMAQAVAAIALSAQAADNILLSVFKRTCALVLNPSHEADDATAVIDGNPDGPFRCIIPAAQAQTLVDQTPFGTGTYVLSIGWLCVLVLTAPLSFFSLSKQAALQIGAVALTLLCILVWLAQFAFGDAGLTSGLVPAFPLPDRFPNIVAEGGGWWVAVAAAPLIPIVVWSLSSVAAATPAWYSQRAAGVSAKRTVWGSAFTAGVICALLGLLGGMALPSIDGASLLAALSNGGGPGGSVWTVTQAATFLFPVVCLATTVPTLAVLAARALHGTRLLGASRWPSHVLVTLLPAAASVAVYSDDGTRDLVLWSGATVMLLAQWVLPFAAAVRYGRIIAAAKANGAGAGAAVTGAGKLTGVDAIAAAGAYQPPLAAMGADGDAADGRQGVASLGTAFAATVAAAEAAAAADAAASSGGAFSVVAGGGAGAGAGRASLASKLRGRRAPRQTLGGVSAVSATDVSESGTLETDADADGGSTLGVGPAGRTSTRDLMRAAAAVSSIVKQSSVGREDTLDFGSAPLVPSSPAFGGGPSSPFDAALAAADSFSLAAAAANGGFVSADRGRRPLTREPSATGAGMRAGAASSSGGGGATGRSGASAPSSLSKLAGGAGGGLSALAAAAAAAGDLATAAPGSAVFPVVSVATGGVGGRLLRAGTAPLQAAGPAASSPAMSPQRSPRKMTAGAPSSGGGMDSFMLTPSGNDPSGAAAVSGLSPFGSAGGPAVGGRLAHLMHRPHGSSGDGGLGFGMSGIGTGLHGSMGMGMSMGYDDGALDSAALMDTSGAGGGGGALSHFSSTGGGGIDDSMAESLASSGLHGPGAYPAHAAAARGRGGSANAGGGGSGKGGVFALGNGAGGPPARGRGKGPSSSAGVELALGSPSLGGMAGSLAGGGGMGMGSIGMGMSYGPGALMLGDDARHDQQHPIHADAGVHRGAFAFGTGLTMHDDGTDGGDHLTMTEPDATGSYAGHSYGAAEERADAAASRRAAAAGLHRYGRPARRPSGGAPAAPGSDAEALALAAASSSSPSGVGGHVAMAAAAAASMAMAMADPDAPHAIMFGLVAPQRHRLGHEDYWAVDGGAAGGGDGADGDGDGSTLGGGGGGTLGRGGRLGHGVGGGYEDEYDHHHDDGGDHDGADALVASDLWSHGAAAQRLLARAAHAADAAAISAPGAAGTGADADENLRPWPACCACNSAYPAPAGSAAAAGPGAGAASGTHASLLHAGEHNDPAAAAAAVEMRARADKRLAWVLLYVSSALAVLAPSLQAIAAWQRAKVD